MVLVRSVASLCALATAALAVTPVEVKGSQLVVSGTDTRFQIIGVDYQPGGEAGYKPQEKKDTLTNVDACLRDAILLQRLGVNTIRVYNLNPELNHDECVSIFNAAGIYMILDVNSPLAGDSLDRTDPVPSYHEGYLKRIFGIVEAFKDYPNLLGFFGGNEVINEDSTKEVPAYIRAGQRDLKDYIANHSDRKIPVGYSAAHVEDLLADTWEYLSCDDPKSPSSKSDFFGLNSYSWCGDSTFENAGYDKLVTQFKDSAIPVFFSEYGCNGIRPRIFTEVEALYGEEMTQAMVGGLVYEYSHEEADYGLVVINDNGTASLMADYDNLMDQYNKLDIKMLQSMDAKSSNAKPKKCSKDLIKGSKFLNDFDLPKLPKGGDKLIKDGVPNAKNGKLVEVKETELKTTVYDVKGQPLDGLKLKILSDDQSNLPGENTSGSPKPADDDEDDKSAAVRGATSGVLAALAVLGTSMMLMA